MSTENQARTRMMRQQNLERNRQQSLLSRVAAEVGIETERLLDQRK